MLRFFKKLFCVLLVAILSSLFFSCEFDHGLGPSKTRISGVVIFDSSSTRPKNVEEVRVAVTAKTLAEILKGEVGLTDIYFGTAVNFGRDTAAYEIALPEGTFPLIGVLWKKRGENWKPTNLIGVYNPNCSRDFSPLAVQLTKERPIASNVNICVFWP